MKKWIAGCALAGLSLISAAPALAGATVASGFDCPDNKRVFFSSTKNHKKALELCKIGPYKYSLTFGPITHPEIRMVQPARNVLFGSSPGGGFSFHNGNTVYEVAIGSNGKAVYWIQPKNADIKEIQLDLNYGEGVNNTAKFLKH